MPQLLLTRLAVLLRAFRLGCCLAAALALAACGPCGDFWWSSQDEIAACHSDAPPSK
jgi:hypothetical protein